MRVLLSTIGSRGDIQPMLALALQLKALGQEPRMCVPPDFQEWIESFGIPVTPIGPKVRQFATSKPADAPAKLSPEQQRQMMIEGTVITQFETIMDAAQGFDIIVGATALQVAAPSVAEKLGIPYVFAAYSPAVLPSRYHAPPVLGLLGDMPASKTDYSDLWTQDAQRWNGMWSAPLNVQRKALNLPPVSDVRGYILTDQPWLAADPILAPWTDPVDRSVIQTGAWILRDERPLSPEVEAFLDSGEPPVYFGFGSTRAPEGLNQIMVQTARGLGRRVIMSEGWSDLSFMKDQPDCLVIGDANLHALFKRVAAVVHHGGSGTTTATARAGAPQLVIPQQYDQFYWAGRVQELGIGTAHISGTPTSDSLTNALEHSLQSSVAARAKSIAAEVRNDGTQIAAQRLIKRL